MPKNQPAFAPAPVPEPEEAPYTFPSLYEIISDVNVYLIAEPKGKTVAFADVILAEQFVLHDVAIVAGANGPFVSMPQRYDEKQDKYFDRINPITKEAREQLNERVIETYMVVKAEADKAKAPPAPPTRPTGPRGGAGPGRR